MFTFYAYNETARPSANLSLRCRADVAPVLCGLHSAGRSHPLTTCGAVVGRETFDNLYVERPTTIAADFASWPKVAGTTYIYDYTINFLNGAQFFSNLETMQSTLRHLYGAFLSHGLHRVTSFGLIPDKDEVNFFKRPFTWES